MNGKLARWVWVVVAAQVVLLLSWAGYHEHVRGAAPTVLLKTRPVDPRDLLRGDYMILSYEISRWAGSTGGVEEGEVFVILKPEGKHHVIAELRALEPDADEMRPWVQAEMRGSAGNRVLIYGIERFFVPEGRGTPNFTQLEVEASVSDQSRLYIKQLWLDGKRFP
jgi:uncharacterized membrane-anchored protein